MLPPDAAAVWIESQSAGRGGRSLGIILGGDKESADWDSWYTVMTMGRDSGAKCREFGAFGRRLYLNTVRMIIE
jgi:hypothetical protein